MAETGGANAYDRLGRLRRLSAPVEVAQIERFGTSLLAAVFRTEVLVLHTTGRRSGLERRTPLACTLDPTTDPRTDPVTAPAAGPVTDASRGLRPDPTGPPTEPPSTAPIDPGRRSGGRPGPLIVVGGAGGQVRTPDWVANLRAEPRAAITRRTRRLDVLAEELTGAERATLWPHLTGVWPRVTTYERRAGHPVPVFRLVPLPAPT